MGFLSAGRQYLLHSADDEGFLAAGGGCLCGHRRHGGALDFYSFARSKAVGFCIVFVALTAAVQYFMGYSGMTLSALIAAVFLTVFWLVGLTARQPEA